MKILNKIKETVENTVGNETLGKVQTKRFKSVIEKHTKEIEDNIFLPQKQVDYAVLDFLDISKDIDTSKLIDPQDIENVEFTLTAPTGLDPNEVEHFLDSLIQRVNEVNSYIQTRQVHFEKLVAEINRLQSELSSAAFQQQNSDIEMYQYQVEKLKRENEKLKSQLTSTENTEPTPKKRNWGR